MLKNLLYQRRWILLFCVLLCALTAVTNLSLLDFLNEQVTQASKGNPGAWLPKYFLGIGALFATSMLASSLLVSISSGALADIRIQLLQGVLSTHFPELEKTGKGALLGVMTDDIDNLANGLSDAPRFIMNTITSLACFSYLAWLSPYAFAWFFGTVVVGGGLTMFILHQGNIRYADYRKLKDQYYVHMHALFDGAKELATNMPRRRHFAQRELFPSVDALKRSQIVWDMYWHFGQAWGSVLLFLALGVAIAAVQHSGDYGLGLITSYFVVITFVAGSVDFVISGVSTMAKAMVSARVISTMKLGEDNHADSAPACDGLQDWKQIHFDAVRYDAGLADGQSFALGPVSLTLRRGEVLFLVGGNGSGKSTYAKVLNGLYQRSGGTIRVDSREIPVDTTVSYRSLFSTVYSDYFLFQSVLDRSGNPVGDAETRDKLALLRMEGKVSAHDGAWSTTALSQGQRKRLALLQCWLDDASVYVLDEWAADQDPGYRAHFYEVLLPIMKSQGKTLVIISHDERYFHLADRVCKFDSGTIVHADEVETAYA
jgi:cyclic peptide transporter